MFRAHTTPAPPLPEARMSRLMDDSTPYDAAAEARELAAHMDVLYHGEEETFAGEFEARCWCGNGFDDEARCKGGHHRDR